MRRMFELPSFDTQYLATIGLDWETVVDGAGRWLLIHVWPVPAGYNVASTTVALQIAALKAKYLTREDVPEDIVANERRIAEETAKEEGKPEQALPKIVEGRVTGFYKDVVLLDQPSVSDNKKSVKALLDEAGVTVTRFVRFEVGQA